MGQSGEASRWRVCYQRGLPRLVFMLLVIVVEPVSLYYTLTFIYYTLIILFFFLLL